MDPLLARPLLFILPCSPTHTYVLEAHSALAAWNQLASVGHSHPKHEDFCDFFGHCLRQVTTVGQAGLVLTEILLCQSPKWQDSRQQHHTWFQGLL